MRTNNQVKIQQIQTHKFKTIKNNLQKTKWSEKHNHRKTWLIFDASERLLDPVENEQGIKHLLKTCMCIVSEVKNLAYDRYIKLHPFVAYFHTLVKYFLKPSGHWLMNFFQLIYNIALPVKFMEF